MRDKRQFFIPRLSDEQTIKWITMVIWQPGKREDVLLLNRQDFQAICFRLLFKLLLKRHCEIEFAELNFDLHLPNTCYAK